MENLPPLNSVKQCLKCGCTALGNQCRYLFVRGNKYYSETVSNRPSEQKSVLERRRVEGLPDDDCMQRTCPRCGYVWHEACADVPQGESTSTEGCVVGGTNYPTMFTKTHFDSADKVGREIIENLEKKGITKASSTKCNESQNFFNLNHYNFIMYCSLPKNHQGKHQIKMQTLEGKEYIFEFGNTDFNIEREKDKAMEQSAIFIQGINKQAGQGVHVKLELDKEVATKEAAESRAEMISHSLFAGFKRTHDLSDPDGIARELEWQNKVNDSHDEN